VAAILEADADTVRCWIDPFNERGCDGLVDQPRPGAGPILDAREQETLRELIDLFTSASRSPTFPAETEKVLHGVAALSTLPKLVKWFGR
jgi:transposase